MSTGLMHIPVMALYCQRQPEDPGERETRKSERFLEVVWKEQRSWCKQKCVRSYIHLGIILSLGLGRSLKVLKIAAAASKIHFPQAAEGHGERVREETYLLHSCAVRSCSCTAAQPGEWSCSCSWLHTAPCH